MGLGMGLGGGGRRARGAPANATLSSASPAQPEQEPGQVGLWESPPSTPGPPLTGQTLSPLPTGALQIESSEETDQGKYECVATNSAGVRYSSPANLYVRGRERRIQVEGRDPPHPILLLLGLAASGLPCPLQT